MRQSKQLLLITFSDCWIRRNSACINFPGIFFSGLLITLLAIGQLMYSSTAAAENAASLDWKASNKAGHCRGSYVEPVRPDINRENPDEISASANSLRHVEDQTTSLTGDVDLESQRMRLKAEFATIDVESETYTAKGTVQLRQPGILVTGTQISGNFSDNQAVIDSASFLMHNNRLRGTATQLTHIEDGTLTVKDGDFTTCEPDNNTWAIRGDEIVLKPSEGYGIARNVTLRIKDLPVAYFPYMRFPINETRQSGFLMPSIGQDSDGGTDIALPYYFNLAPNVDATYTPRSIWKRGLLHEGELRYLTPDTSNMLAGTFLPSDSAYETRSLDPTSVAEDPDRWLIHVKHKGSQGPWRSSINFTRVSDIDYLGDLGGFTNTDAAFDRALNQSNDPALLRTGSLSYIGNDWSSKLSLRSFQNLNQLQPQQYEMLPRLEVKAGKQWGFLQANALVQATEFENKREIATGTRVVVDTSLRAPFESSWGFVRPGVRLIQRHYKLQDTMPGERDDADITTGIVSLDAGLVFERAGQWLNKATRQTLEPRIHYLYVNDKFQDDLPIFDSTLLTPNYSSLFRENRFTGYDRIGDENRIAVGITTRHFNSKTGNELVTASIGQIFHRSDREVGLSQFRNALTEQLTDNTSPVYAELTLNTKDFRFHTSYEHNTGSGRSNRGYISLGFQPAPNKLFNISYSMTDESQQRVLGARGEEESDVSFYWPLGKSDRWQVIGRWNYGWDNAQTIESLLGVEYNACCWKTRILFKRNLEEPRAFLVNNPGQAATVRFDRRADSGIYFEFQLSGLASLGGRLDTLLRQSIPNYTAK